MCHAKIAKNCHLGIITQHFSDHIFATKACIDNRKKIVKHQYLLHMSHNVVNFGPLAAEIVSLVSGTPANFNGFRVLAAILHGTVVVSVSQTAALNRGCHLYSAGRPSHWALAHISSFFVTSIPSGILIYSAIWPQRIWAESCGELCLFARGELGPLLTECGQGRGLPECQVSY